MNLLIFVAMVIGSFLLIRIAAVTLELTGLITLVATFANALRQRDFTFHQIMIY